MTSLSALNVSTTCRECGMSLHDDCEYHPYAACLMFKACGDRRTVLANLNAVLKHGSMGASSDAIVQPGEGQARPEAAGAPAPLSSNLETLPEPTRYSRPEGVMGGPCLHCQASQPEHRGLTCDEVREHRKKAMRRTFAQAHANATLETIKQYLETMIHSAEVYVDAEDVITAYKIKTGALHKLIGHLGLSIPVNHPVVGAPETFGDCAPFLKEGETPAECIARNRADTDAVLTLLAQEKRKNEALQIDYSELNRVIHAAWYNAGQLLSRDDSPFHWIREIRDEWVEIQAGRRAVKSEGNPT